MESISKKDRDILRALASRQMELASAPDMQNLKRRWTEHNSCKPGLPMVVVEWDTFAGEVISPKLRCEGEAARGIEWRIYSNFIGRTEFMDDHFVPDYMPVSYSTWFKAFDIDVVRESASDGTSLGHHFREAIKDLGDDFHKLKPSAFGVDRAATQRTIDMLSDVFGDILPVKLKGSCLYSVPTQSIIHIMSMETMLFSLYDYPDLFHSMMRMLTDDYLSYYRFIERENLILPTTGNEGVGNGTFAFTDELPESGALTTKDVWGFMDSQETTGISPDMFAEFIFPYYREISSQYGLLSYGCCEAVHPVWDNCLSKLSNLRKLSISPWCDEAYMGEQLRGKKIVYHRKPSPNYLGVDVNLDAPALSKHIKNTLMAAKGCVIEFTQRDVYTVHNNMEKVREYVRIIRSLCEKFA